VIEIGVGDARITATDRTDTVVEVRPSDSGTADGHPGRGADPGGVRGREAADQDTEELEAVQLLQ